ncbi:MAG: hypothetical protein Q8K08_00680 [Pseudotabrizicola sp.]|nr:hypothetical protein [Pseudotabrizicola sp.]
MGALLPLPQTPRNMRQRAPLATNAHVFEVTFAMILQHYKLAPPSILANDFDMAH